MHQHHPFPFQLVDPAPGFGIQYEVTGMHTILASVLLVVGPVLTSVMAKRFDSFR